MKGADKKSSAADEPLDQELQAMLNATPAALPGLMFHGGQIRRVYFPAVGEQRVVWRKAYCLTAAEAIEEADRFCHSAQEAISQVARMAKARAQHSQLKLVNSQHVTHWTENLSPRAYKCVMKILHVNPSGLTVAAAQALIRKPKMREQLAVTLTPMEQVSLTEALNIEL